jgi:hypothetical protein
MKDQNHDRLTELCAQALSETNPDELMALFSEINDILWKHIMHVQEVIERQESLERLREGLPYLM